MVTFQGWDIIILKAFLFISRFSSCANSNQSEFFVMLVGFCSQEMMRYFMVNYKIQNRETLQSSSLFSVRNTKLTKEISLKRNLSLTVLTK